MSSLRAVVLPTQQLEPIEALETEAYLRPRNGPQVPLWAARTEEGIRIVARLGFSPTPTIVLVSAIVVGLTLHR